MDGCWRQWGRHGIKARYLGWFSHWFVVWCNLRGFMSYSCEIKASHSRSPKSPVQYTYSRQPWLLHTQPFSHTSWCWTISYDESSRCGNAGSETQIAGSIPNHTFRQQWCFLPGMSEKCKSLLSAGNAEWKDGSSRNYKQNLKDFSRHRFLEIALAGLKGMIPTGHRSYVPQFTRSQGYDWGFEQSTIGWLMCVNRILKKHKTIGIWVFSRVRET